MKKLTKAIIAGTMACVTAFSIFSLSACADGEDGKDFSLYTTYLELCETGEFEGTFSDFIERYLNPEISTEEGLFSSAINAALLNVVSIQVGCEYSSGWGGGTLSSYSMGSGVVWDVDRNTGDATIVTNCHVVYDSFESTIEKEGRTYTRTRTPLSYHLYLYGMEEKDLGNQSVNYAIPFTVLGYSISNDIAVLKVEGSEVIKNSLLTKVTVGDSDKAAVGDDVFLVGNACGEGISATRGILSVASETVSVYDATGIKSDSHLISVRSMRTDAPANEGNSGGGFFNRKGELIGVLFAGDTDANGIADCLPISGVKGVVDSITRNCNGNTVQTKKAYLGITSTITKTEQVYDAEKGVTIKNTITVSNSGTTNSSFKDGDVLRSAKVVASDGTVRAKVDEITRNWQVSDIMWFAQAGDNVEIVVVRSGEEKTITVPITQSSMKSVS